VSRASGLMRNKRRMRGSLVQFWVKAVLFASRLSFIVFGDADLAFSRTGF
jgi:hypothetical protein